MSESDRLADRSFGRSTFDKFGEAASAFAGRSEFVLQTKLNAIADAFADLMEHQAIGESGDLMDDMEDLRAAAGLEEHA